MTKVGAEYSRPSRLWQDLDMIKGLLHILGLCEDDIFIIKSSTDAFGVMKALVASTKTAGKQRITKKGKYNKTAHQILKAQISRENKEAC